MTAWLGGEREREPGFRIVRDSVSLRPQPAEARVNCAREPGMRKCLEINDCIPRFMGRRASLKCMAAGPT